MSVVAHQHVLERVHRHSVLSSQRPRRSEVLQLEVDNPSLPTGYIAIWRNHAIEPVLPFLDIYLRHAGLDLRPVLGEYDDTLTFAPPRAVVAELVWFDLDRVSLDGRELLDWFASRLDRVVNEAVAPVVVVPISGRPEVTAAVVERLQPVRDLRCADPWPLCIEAGVVLVDERTASLTGSRLSKEAQFHIARALGSHWLPAALLPPRKMLAVDLDETLHRGVLGEDGVAGVQVSQAHRRLHDYLKRLASQGVMLALVSRNEPEDVARLFAERQSDYGLTLDDFFAVEVSWGSKADAIRRASADARIAEDAVVFLDDNPGELLTVGLECPNVALIHASDDADCTIDALRWQAGLWRWSADEVAKLRVADLKANVRRERLKDGSADTEHYLQELGVHAVIEVNPIEHLSRLADLSNKTNQFNLNLRRLSEHDLRVAMEEPNSYVASVALSDRLSDSGVIALLVARRDNKRLFVDELAISCRALGRGLESLLLSQVLRCLPCWKQLEEVCFEVREIDRNLLARRWLAKTAGLPEGEVSSGQVTVGVDVFDAVNVPAAVTISATAPPANDN